MTTQLRLPTDALAMLVKIKLDDNGSIGLYLDRARPGIVQAFRGRGTRYPIGKELARLSGDDILEFDEWAEFIIRSRIMPNVQPPPDGDDDTVSCHLLQYWSFLGGWYVVQLTCNRRENRAMAVFYKLDRFPQRSILHQLIKMKSVQLMATHIHDGGYWFMDCLNHTTFLSRRLAQALGLGEQDRVLPTQDYLETIHPHDRMRVIETLDHIDEIIVSCDSHNLTPDGRTVRLKTFASPVYGENGSLDRIFGYSEILAADPAASELAIDKDRFLSIVEHSGDLFFVVNGDGVFTYLSPNTVSLMGAGAERYLGRTMGSLTEDHPHWTQPMAEIMDNIQQNTCGVVDFSARIAGGETRWYRFSIFSALVEWDGETQTLVVGHDVTKEHLKEQKLRFLGTHDHLTGVYNRTTFWRLLEDVHQRKPIDYCLVLLDVNGLKLTNHVYGQSKGDQVLRDVTEAVKRAFPANRHIARISGDEFAVIAYGMPADQVVFSCEAVSEFCAGTNSRMLPISVAWGMACRSEAESGQQLYQVAEGRMYDNKMIQKRSMHSQVVFSLKEALKARNAETSDHMERMEHMVGALGKRLGLATHDFNRLMLLASLHDVGKLGIPDSIINKPGPLTGEEWDIMRSHTEIGHRIVLASPELSGIALETLSHHERWDGKGYPYGKKGGEIPLLSQIISVVDSYDVMTNRRVYKEPMSHEEAVEELRRCRGTQFSPVVTDLFIEILSSQLLLPKQVQA